MFWKKKRNCGIRFRYIVDGVERDSMFRINPEKESKALLKDIIKNKKEYAEEALEVTNINNIPKVNINKFEVPKQIEDLIDVYLIAEVTFNFYKEPIETDFSTGLGAKMLVLVILTTIIGAIFFGMSYYDTRKKVKAHEKAGVECTVQFIGDQPYSIVVGSNEYMLEPSGKMSLHTRTSLNPWDQQVINSGKCKRVNLVSTEKPSNSDTDIVFTEI